ncbi:hypothetical protein EPO15_06720 [bacterium]|nr:MAG: hypothetical protein EPO15_06720 [bacterium]
MARAPRARLAAFAALLLGAACRKPPAGEPVSFDAPGPAAVGRPTRIVARSAAAAAEAAFAADMAHPGMVPVFARASETAAGRYEADVTWTMAGDWSVLFEASWKDKRRARGRLPVRVAP